ncbi:MAG: hypothetical protein NkDv07_0300 [Candidatus Improbicoccus devescovinae]|nr:MAG: hypothetical protein NkDv07_0300 [Candidatus Improbicoccus devescovinae]
MRLVFTRNRNTKIYQKILALVLFIGIFVCKASRRISASEKPPPSIWIGVDNHSSPHGKLITTWFGLAVAENDDVGLVYQPFHGALRENLSEYLHVHFPTRGGPYDIPIIAYGRNRYGDHGWLQVGCAYAGPNSTVDSVIKAVANTFVTFPKREALIPRFVYSPGEVDITNWRDVIYCRAKCIAVWPEVKCNLMPHSGMPKKEYRPAVVLYGPGQMDKCPPDG